MADMRKPTFERLCEIVYETSGIKLSARKEALVCARVGKRMRLLGVGGYDEYLTLVEENADEVVGLLDAVSTNVTGFFREPHHFEVLGKTVATWYEQGQRRFRFWSAACSTGEESLTMAMTLREALPVEQADVKVLATDISTQALCRCEQALFSDERITPVSATLRERYFERVSTPQGELWHALPSLTEMIAYRRLNLSKPPFPMKGPLDAVMCRNVMIYFDDAVRIRLLDDVHRLLKPGGLLIVGHAESLAGMIGNFSYVQPSVYRKD